MCLCMCRHTHTHTQYSVWELPSWCLRKRTTFTLLSRLRRKETASAQEPCSTPPKGPHFLLPSLHGMYMVGLLALLTGTLSTLLATPVAGSTLDNAQMMVGGFVLSSVLHRPFRCWAFSWILLHNC
jgi:hypothetical protein